MNDSAPDPDQPARRDQFEGEGAIRGTARMEAFADGVFAIAFTLPIVEIAIPEVAGDGAVLGDELRLLGPAYGGYILASVVIGLYWVQHHFSGAIFRTTGHWFVIATTAFLAAIGFIAFPARVLAEHFPDVAARPAAARYWVVALAGVSVAWLIKWTVGIHRTHIDARLETRYVSRLTRQYQLVALANVGAAGIVFWNWQAGLLTSALLMLWLVFPPETPRYTTEAPIIEGEVAPSPPQ